MVKLGEHIVIFCILIIILFNIIFNITYKTVIEQSMYDQNKLALKHFKTCYKDVSGKPIDRINKCLSNSLTSDPTGDAFVVDIKSMRVIWDNSIDCKTDKTMYLTKDSICKLASNQKSCINLSNNIHKGYDSYGKWYFDNSAELDDWIILPDDTHNFDGSLRAEKGIVSQYAVVQGNQYDEYTRYFKYLPLIVNIGTVIILLFLLIIFTLFTQIKEYNNNFECKYKG